MLIASIGLPLVIFGSFIYDHAQIDMETFQNSADRLLEKSEALSKKAAVFNEKNVLSKLGPNHINGFCYLFGEHIEEASYENLAFAANKDKPSIYIFNIEFDSKDKYKLVPKKDGVRLEGGLLKLKYTKDNYLESVGDVAIPKDDIGEVEIRMKLKDGKRVELGWSKEAGARWDDPVTATQLIGSITIDVIPDGEFHTYKINAKSVLKFLLEPGDLIRKIFLSPSNMPKDAVEIDYVRFISKKGKYGDQLFNETYEKIDKEMRKVIYANTPIRLKFNVEVPKGLVYLRFGMGILEKNDPVTFKVAAKNEDVQQKEIFSTEISDTDKWQGIKLDISEWSGKKVEISFEADSLKGNIAFWSNPILYTPPENRFNVIIVLEDALRADHLSCYGYDRETTPALDKFAKNGILFSNAFSQETKTRPSVPTIMTSLYPTATGVWNFSEALDDKYLTLAEVMRRQGFATGSFIQNDNAGPAGGLHQGFSNLFDESALGTKAEGMYNENLYAWIEANIDRNIFLYIHLCDPHGPYDPLKPFDSWYKEFGPGNTLVDGFKEFDPPWVKMPTLEGRRLLYDGEVRCNDYYLEKFLEKLEEYNLLKNTLIIFMADHGEYLGDYGLWGHIPPGHMQIIHVPIMVVYPKELPKNVVINQPIQLIDIMPTILDFASINKNDMLLEGDSLIPLMHGGKIDFWNDRICFSEEDVNKDKDDKNEWASIIYKNLHIINSGNFWGLSKIARLCGVKIFPDFALGTRAFCYLENKNEKNYLNSFFFDLFFKRGFKHIVRELQKNNMEIWEAVTQGKKQIIKYDPEVQERLRALGYL